MKTQNTYRYVRVSTRDQNEDNKIDIVVLDMPLPDTRRGKNLPENFHKIHKDWIGKKITLK